MHKPLLPKETVESFTLLIILSLICILIGVFTGMQISKIEHDFQKYQYARKLDNCIDLKRK